MNMYNIKLNVQQLNMAANLIGRWPYAEVKDLLDFITEQAREQEKSFTASQQMEAPEPKEKEVENKKE